MGAQIEAHELTVPVTVNLVAADEAAASEADHEVTEEVVILKAARAQEEARERADLGDIDGARGLLRDAAKDLREAAPGSPRADELDRQAAEMDEHVDLLASGRLDRLTAKKMRYQSRDRRNRRDPS